VDFYVAEILVYVTDFINLFTKEYPEGIFRFAVNGMRWLARAQAYEAFMVTEYPPFEFEDTGNPGAV
jgi:Domain of unknown function (DUF4389)